MSEANSPVHECPSGERFKAAAGEFSLPVVETIEALRDLDEALRQESKTSAKPYTHREYLHRTITYIEDQAGVALTLDEADWIVDKLNEIYHRKKKERRDVIDAMWTSPSSSASTPSA